MKKEYYLGWRPLRFSWQEMQKMCRRDKADAVKIMRFGRKLQNPPVRIHTM